MTPPAGAKWVRHAATPRLILLCDVFSTESRLDELRRTLCGDLGYRGDIRICSVARRRGFRDLRCHTHNVPNLLYATRLNRGALIVDDSAPHWFRPDDARERLRLQGDILFTEGRLLRLPEPVRQSFSESA